MHMQRSDVAELFLELVQLDSPSLREGRVARRCRDLLEECGFQVVEDNAGIVLGGESGNLIATLPGSLPGPTVLLTAHMDTVQPGEGVRPEIDDRGVIRSSGSTVLGADDKAGVAAILAAMRAIFHDGKAHLPIQVVLTVAEELGLQGVKHLDRSLIRADLGLALDSGRDLGVYVTASPSSVKWEATFVGRAAHAGNEPERGISAIKMAARAVAEMPHGRVDKETTMNIGSFVGQGPTNVVSDKVVLQGEARSRSPERLHSVIDAIRRACQSSADESGGTVSFDVQTLYDGFRLTEESDAVVRVRTVLEALGLDPIATESGGGSDANVFNQMRVPTVNIGVGYRGNHTTHEEVHVDDLVTVAEVARLFCTARHTSEGE